MEFLRRYWPLLSILALVVGLALFSPHQAQYDPAHPYAYQEAPKHLSWGKVIELLTMLFTGFLALFAFVQVYDSRKSSERQMRAYVGVSAVKVFMEPVPAKAGKGLFDTIDLRGILTLKNAGSTPAYDLTGVAGMRWGASFDHRWLDEANKFAQSAMLLPDAEFYYRTKRSVHELASERPDDATGLWTFYLFGRIEYFDCFHRKRWTNFRFTLAGDILGTEGGHATVHPCEQGNDAN